MISDDVSPEIERLIHLVIKSMVEKTNSNLKIPIGFRQVYMEACKREPNYKYDYSDLEMRQHVRDILLRNDYIFVNPDDVEEVFITKKALL
jgi:hypothetical protein